MVEDWSVEKVSASTAIERGSVGFESTDKVQRVTKAASKKANGKPSKAKQSGDHPREAGGGWCVCGVFGETKESASGIDEQADGSKVLCSWRVVGTASLLSRKSESLKWPRKRWVEREQLKAYYSLSDRGVKGV